MLPLRLLFVDFEKVFDSNELNVMLKASAEEGIDGNYVEVVKEANKSCSTDIKLFTNSGSIITFRG